jgi:hypothetical protein
VSAGEKALRRRVEAVLAKWKASIGYGQGGTAQHRGAVEGCILDLSCALRAARAPGAEEGR